jgi:hypothetical protein
LESKKGIKSGFCEENTGNSHSVFCQPTLQAKGFCRYRIFDVSAVLNNLYETHSKGKLKIWKIKPELNATVGFVHSSSL